MSANSANPVITMSQITSAGLAATGASLVTSRFGVAGTLLGAALTAMLVTGGSAILRAYLESLSGRVREVPTKLRARRERGAGGADSAMPGSPDLRDNFVGRMRAALAWFSHLPTLRRRSILIRGLLAAAVALVLCLVLIWGTEKLIGNSLSCGLWAKCPYGATPGIHPLGLGGTGADSSLSGGAMNTGVEGASPLDRVRQNPNPFGGDDPVFRNPGGGAAPSASPEPAPSPGPVDSPEPVASPDPAASPPAGRQAPPSSASPAAGQ